MNKITNYISKYIIEHNVLEERYSGIAVIGNTRTCAIEFLHVTYNSGTTRLDDLDIVLESDEFFEIMTDIKLNMVDMNDIAIARHLLVLSPTFMKELNEFLHKNDSAATIEYNTMLYTINKDITVEDGSWYTSVSRRSASYHLSYDSFVIGIIQRVINVNFEQLLLKDYLYMHTKDYKIKTIPFIYDIIDKLNSMDSTHKYLVLFNYRDPSTNKRLFYYK